MISLLHETVNGEPKKGQENKKRLYTKLEVGHNKGELHALSNCVRIMTTKVHYLHPSFRVTNTALLQQGAFLEKKVTSNRPLGARDWVSEGAKPKQVSKKSRSVVVHIASEPPDPRFGASSVDSSNDSSLSQGRRVERTSRERNQRGQFERKINRQEWKIREHRAAKRGVRREKKM